MAIDKLMDAEIEEVEKRYQAIEDPILE